jgi:hypothetical protein
MSLETDFVTLLKNNVGVAALVVDRIAWGQLPAARPRPLISLWMTTRPIDYTMDGPSGIDAAYIQIDCWADSYLAAGDVANAVRAGLGGFRGWVDFTGFQGIFITGQRNTTDPAVGAPAARYERVSLDATIWSEQFDFDSLQRLADEFHAFVNGGEPWGTV